MFFLAGSDAKFDNEPIADSTRFAGIQSSSWYSPEASSGYNHCVVCHAVRQTRGLKIVLLGTLVFVAVAFYVGLQSSAREREAMRMHLGMVVGIVMVLELVSLVYLYRCFFWLWQFRKITFKDVKIEKGVKESEMV